MNANRSWGDLEFIAKSIRELYRAFGPSRLKSFAAIFDAGDSAEEIRGNPCIGTQQLAKRIAEHYRLPATTVIVTYSTSLRPPGRVELSQANEFFVELRNEFREDPKSVTAILAHEIAHIFLHRCGVRFPDEFENEVLTDTTAVYLGFGPVIMNAATETRHFGYLTLEGFGYIQAKRDLAFGHNSTPIMASGRPLAAFNYGRRQVNFERTRTPYAPPAPPAAPQLMDRLLNKLLRRPPPQQPRKPTGTSLTFECICCSQKLRIPILGKQIAVRCSNCDARLICYT